MRRGHGVAVRVSTQLLGEHTLVVPIPVEGIIMLPIMGIPTMLIHMSHRCISMFLAVCAPTLTLVVPIPVVGIIMLPIMGIMLLSMRLNCRSMSVMKGSVTKGISDMVAGVAKWCRKR